MKKQNRKIQNYEEIIPEFCGNGEEGWYDFYKIFSVNQRGRYVLCPSVLSLLTLVELTTLRQRVFSEGRDRGTKNIRV